MFFALYFLLSKKKSNLHPALGMEVTEEMNELADEHAAIRRAREGALRKINLAQSSRDGSGGDDSRVGPELAAVLMRENRIFASLGQDFCASLIRCAKTVVLPAGTSW